MVDERLAAKPEDAFAFRPVGSSDPLAVFAHVLDAYCLGGGRDASHLSLADREASKVTIDARPVGIGLGPRFACAHDQV